MKHAMTKGDVTKQIVMFALPLLLGNLFQQMYNMADAAIVGQTLGPNALGAVGVSSSVQFLVLGFCIGITAGFAIPVATCFGAKEEDKMRQYIYLGALLTVLFAIGITVLTAIFTDNILELIKTPSDIFQDSYSYLYVLFLGIPCTLLYNFLASTLRAVGDSKTPFYFLAFSSLLNIGLDLYFIKSLQLGVMGASLATVLSQGISGVLCFIYMRKKFKILTVTKKDCVYDTKMVKHLLDMGLPMGFQFSITAIGSMVQQSANNALGTIYVDGFAAGVKLKQFAMCPFDALAASLSTFVSQNYGAKQPDRIKKGIRNGNIIAIIYGVGIGLVLYFFGRYMSMVFVPATHSEVLDASWLYLSRMGFCYWVLGILVVTRASVQGIGWSKQAVLVGVIEMIARILCAYFLVPKIGYLGICWTDQIAWISAVIYIVPVCRLAVDKAQRYCLQ